jgi:hypothetical protein
VHLEGGFSRGDGGSIFWVKSTRMLHFEMKFLRLESKDSVGIDSGEVLFAGWEARCSGKGAISIKCKLKVIEREG